jgi:hypothetical protein
MGKAGASSVEERMIAIRTVEGKEFRQKRPVPIVKLSIFTGK